MKINRKIKRRENNSFKRFKESFLKTFVDIVNARNVSCIDAVLMVTLCYLQMVGILVSDTDDSSWNDNIIGGFIRYIFMLIRIIPYIKYYQLNNIYWIFYAISNP